MVKRGSASKAQVDECSSKDELCSLKKVKLDSNITTELTNIACSRKKLLAINDTPRRSRRIQKGAPSSPCQDLEPILVENIEASEGKNTSEDKEDHRGSSEVKSDTEATMGARTLEDKIDYVILLLEEQGKIINAIMSKVTNRNFSAQIPCMAGADQSKMENCKYRNMHVVSKMDELEKENLDLRKKLEIALLELDGHKKVQILYSDVIEKLKDTVLVSSLAKMNELLLNSLSRKSVLGFTAAAASPESHSRVAKTKGARTKGKEKAARVGSKKHSSAQIKGKEKASNDEAKKHSLTQV